MSKVDDMRRQREERFAESARRAASAPKRAVALAPAAPAKAAVVAEGEKASSTTEDEEGRCPECGKTKPLANGVMANHQHGFGKACAGSRKKPATAEDDSQA